MPFRIVLVRFRTSSDSFGSFSDSFGRFRTISDRFWMGSDGFVAIDGHLHGAAGAAARVFLAEPHEGQRVPRVRIDVQMDLQAPSGDKVHGVAVEEGNVLVTSTEMNPGEGLGRNVCRRGWEAGREGTKADREELSQGVPEIRAGTIVHVNRSGVPGRSSWRLGGCHGWFPGDGSSYSKERLRLSIMGLDLFAVVSVSLSSI